ncbi:metabotropic glutamate receptor 8-like, partial [Contarinia nasturtii]|uniref:metabotropic glutamate receptor 8-like n=1 Tax=Contarinia nasturtii TaxID=265458 RepID=UPI0012D4B260
MLLMIIIHTLARMSCCRAWLLYIVVLLMFNRTEMVKYASPPSSSSISINNNSFRNDSRLLVTHFERTAPVNTMPYMNSLGTNRGGGRTTILSHSRNGLPSRSNKWSSDFGRLIRTGGDIILGGIFPMHEHNINNPEYPCGMVKEEKGIQRLEAMMYALDKINKNDNDLLPNVTLGSLIIDSCSSDTYALEQSMEFVRYYMNQDMSEYKCENGKPPIFIPHKPVSGVIGASFSVVSIMVANILRLFRVSMLLLTYYFIVNHSYETRAVNTNSATTITH